MHKVIPLALLPLWPILWLVLWPLWLVRRAAGRDVERIKKRFELAPVSWTAGHPLGTGVQHYQRGLELRDKGEWREAVSEFDKAIDLNPKHVNAYAERGLVYAELGDSQRAIADMEKAISLTRDPDITANLEAAIKTLRERR